MPENVWLWALVVLAVMVVVLLALIKGGRVDVGLNPPRLNFTEKRGTSARKVDVLEDAELDEVKAGNVTGLQGGAGTDATDVRVMNRVKAKKSEFGDITGMSAQAPDASTERQDK